MQEHIEQGRIDGSPNVVFFQEPSVLLVRCALCSGSTKSPSNDDCRFRGTILGLRRIHQQSLYCRLIQSVSKAINTCVSCKLFRLSVGHELFLSSQGFCFKTPKYKIDSSSSCFNFAQSKVSTGPTRFR